MHNFQHIGRDQHLEVVDQRRIGDEGGDIGIEVEDVVMFFLQCVHKLIQLVLHIVEANLASLDLFQALDQRL